MKGKKSLRGEFCNCYCQNFAVFVFLQKLCDFKMDLIKWQLNFVSCNFGLTSYLWFQTKLHSTQFNYHYELYDTRSNY